MDEQTKQSIRARRALAEAAAAPAEAERLQREAAQASALDALRTFVHPIVESFNSEFASDGIYLGAHNAPAEPIVVVRQDQGRAYGQPQAILTARVEQGGQISVAVSDGQNGSRAMYMGLSDTPVPIPADSAGHPIGAATLDPARFQHHLTELVTFGLPSEVSPP